MNKPINLVIPNTVEEKMQSILNLSSAIKSLADALVSVQVQVNISGNTISDTNIGIQVDLEEYNVKGNK